MDDRDRLTALITGYRTSAAVTAAVELGLVDLLADGARSAADMARAAGTDADSTRRLLHALATLDLLVEHADGVFELTDVGRLLCSATPGSLAPQALIAADPAIWAAWKGLAEGIRTGRTAFEVVNGVDVWTHRHGHPQHDENFNRQMTSLSAAIMPAVAAAYDFGAHGHVVDVGGGQGSLLEAVLRRYPGTTGTVFDQPHVVGTEAPEGLAERWSAQGGSFFEAVPPADCYVMKWILHDWDDEECVTILRRCRESLRPGGAVLVVELLLDRPGDERATAMMDLNMLAVAGGRERSEAGYAALFDAAGLRLERVLDTGKRVAVLVAAEAG